MESICIAPALDRSQLTFAALVSDFQMELFCTIRVSNLIGFQHILSQLKRPVQKVFCQIRFPR